MCRFFSFASPESPAHAQDEHPALPESVTENLQGFLLECFRKDPQRRPGARALLRHAWLRQQRATLRSTWSNTVKARGGRTDAHASVTNVVERILQVRPRRQNPVVQPRHKSDIALLWAPGCSQAHLSVCV